MYVHHVNIFYSRQNNGHLISRQKCTYNIQTKYINLYTSIHIIIQ